MNEILFMTECGKSLLVPLDLTAVFDTVDHDMLISTLKKSLGITGLALQW